MSSAYDFKEPDPLLFYVHRAPTIKSTKPPLLILLHGTGSNEQDLFSFADQLPGKFLVVSARAPYTIERGSYTWYELHFVNGKPVYNKEQAEQSRKTILAFIEQLKTKHDFDPAQVYLCGFSQGGIMSYSVGLTRPDKVKGIAVMSGRLQEEVKNMVAPKEQLKSLQVFISHGTQDNVLTVQYARESEAYLKQLGITPQYKEYPAPHTISQDMFRDLLNWLN
ncbi:MAG: phospholipase/Carboxylesterase [Chitinophagaceae bacterium]|nr:phospholipase/Carboxylesterase [Chitinophagaceae bacterium]